MLLNNDGVMEKWLKMEFQNINKNIVKTQVTIAELLKMEVPKTNTRSGEDYLFDIEALSDFSSMVPILYHRRLRLPIYFYKDLRVKDSCFLTDEVAGLALQKTKDLDAVYTFKDGKLWLSRPLAWEISRKYPTLFQFVVY